MLWSKAGTNQEKHITMPLKGYGMALLGDGLGRGWPW